MNTRNRLSASFVLAAVLGSTFVLAGCETRERVVVRGPPPPRATVVVAAPPPPVVQERVIVR